MTIESSRMQVPTAAPNPVLNVQNEIQKGVNKDEQKTNAAINTSKQVMATPQVDHQPKQQQVETAKTSDGHVDIKI
jgi:hypothetical protein